MIDKMDYNDKEIKKIIEETQNSIVPVFNEEEAWNNINAQTSDNSVLKLYYKKALKYAAVVIFGLFVGILISKVNFSNSEENYVEINASKGQKIDISLPDGNKIWINSNSSIRYPANFKEFNKKIFVQGEMYFDFSENDLSPISIIVNNVVIQGFNSAFNIKTSADNKSAEITVSKGWVAINNAEMNIDNIVVDAGYTCSFRSELPLFIEENKNVNYLAWKTGKLYFKDTPLKVVATTLSEFYDIPIRVDGKIGYCNFSSNYNNVNIKTILKDIESIITSTINVRKNLIVITGEDC